MPVPILRTHLLALAGVLLLAGSVARAETVAQLGNFAIGADVETVVFRLGDQILAEVGYGSLLENRALPRGELRISAHDTSGRLLAERSLTVLAGRSYAVFAAGNGEGTPYRIPVVAESLLPLRDGMYTIFWYNVGLHDSIPVHVRRFCGRNPDGSPRGPVRSTTLDPSTEAQSRSDGSVPLGIERCYFEARSRSASGELLAETEASIRPGGLQRVLFTGDGATTPHALLVLDSTRQALAEVEPDERMDGLWFDPEDPGSGFSLMVASEGDGPPKVSGTFYGYDADGEPRWIFMDIVEETMPAARPPNLPYTFLEPVGGDAAGTRQPARLKVGFGQLTFQSCREATLYTLDASGGRMPRRLGYGIADNEQLYRLLRLLPIGGCNPTPVSNDAEVTP